jgi:flagellar protein FlaI
MERVFAYAKIYWDEKRNCMVYLVVEPHLTPQDERLIEQIKKDMEERLDIDFFKLGEVKAKELVVQEIGKILLSKSIDRRKMEIIQYYVQRDIIGLGKIEPLMKDANIEDISCDGHGIPIYIYHRNSLLGSIITNVMFSDGDELDSFAMKLAQKGGKSISVAEPLVDGSLPDGSRVQATLGTDIARRGSNFTIRKFTDKPLTPVHMMEYGTVDSTVMAYLWLAIEYRKSILISGGTATGKTSFLNALSLFIKPSLKIVSIEDTPELRLPHPHWIPEVARTPIATEGKTGEVSLFDLLRESLRQRPDYIIVGEVRGKEAFVLFQQIASIPPEEKILILNDSHLKHVPIEAAMGRRFSTFSVDPVKETFHIAPVRETIRHSPVKELYKIKTRRGREVTVTSAHSVFTYDNGLVPIMVKDMKVGDRIAIPARLPSGYNDIEHIDLMELDGIRVYSPGLIKEASRKLGFEKASKIAGFTTISNYYGVNNCALPSESFIRLMEAAGIDYAKQMEKISVRFQRNSTPSEPKLKITPELLRLIGYYISEGSLNKAYRNNTISIYNSNERILEDMRKCITKVTGKRPKERVTKGFSFATELSFSHKTIYELFRQKCGQRSYQRKVPDFILGLSKEKIGEMLSAMYTGDGHLRKKSFEYATSSRQLANDVLILLSAFGIVGSIEMAKGTNLDVYKIVFYRSEFQKRFLEYVKPLKKIPQLKKPVKTLEKDIFMDIIKSIERITTEKEVDVYDLCVPGYQNFIGGFGGILLHNTGHSGLATIHAASLPQLLDRLTTPPISLPPTLIENIDIIVFLTQVKIGDKYLRRANEVMEVKGTSGDKPVTESVFKWKPISDIFEHTGKSVVIENISRMTGLTEKSMMDEIRARKSVLDWMHEKKMFDYRDVAKIINGYYSDPERILNLVESI